MINIAFEGGLGNQMFQYAYARYAQIKTGDEVIYDKSKYLFEKIEFRDFQIEEFCIPDTWHVAALEKKRLKRFGYRYIIYLIVTSFYLGANRIAKNKELTLFDNTYQKIINSFGYYRCHSEKYKDFQPSIWHNSYIRGHWFTSKYANEIRSTLLEEFVVDSHRLEQHASIIQRIDSCNSVAVHIRRGDYVKLGMVVCDINYYKRVMAKICKEIEAPTFFVFSDDIEWVQKNLNVNLNVVYMSENDALTDMMIMSHCKHYIISNSTFSWWASWLGKYEGKIVYAPDVWLNSKTVDTELFCSNWKLEPTNTILEEN